MTLRIPTIIRSVQGADLVSLADLAKRTFIAAFSEQNLPSDVEHYVAKAFNHAQIRSEFTEAHSHFYFAEQDVDPIGYLKLNEKTSQTESLFENALEIERIYVDSDSIGNGIGQALIDFAIGKAREAGHNWLWLGVWEENRAAVRFYKRNGFDFFGDHDFMFGETRQTDLIMRKAIMTL